MAATRPSMCTSDISKCERSTGGAPSILSGGPHPYAIGPNAGAAAVPRSNGPVPRSNGRPPGAAASAAGGGIGGRGEHATCGSAPMMVGVGRSSGKGAAPMPKRPSRPLPSSAAWGIASGVGNAACCCCCCCCIPFVSYALASALTTFESAVLRSAAASAASTDPCGPAADACPPFRCSELCSDGGCVPPVAAFPGRCFEARLERVLGGCPSVPDSKPNV
mmetsp:Transcript_41735/g.124831  ORF Transcript_41735/g.124831 Transcript_41735/m.124831 type:complete len:220 (+) Transcript_41735:335-994(+)